MRHSAQRDSAKEGLQGRSRSPVRVNECHPVRLGVRLERVARRERVGVSVPRLEVSEQRRGSAVALWSVWCVSVLPSPPRRQRRALID